MATASKNSPTEEETRSLLECPVCVSTFRNPKSLRCGHSICFECCEQLRTGYQISCPVCRTKTPIPVEGLPTNFALQDLVEHHATRKEEKKYACSSCERRQVIDELWTCSTCVSTLICANCAIKDHRGHDLQMVSEIISRRREELAEWRQRMENTIRETDSRRRQMEANLVRIEQRSIQLNATLRTKLEPCFNEVIKNVTSERDALFKTIQDVDVSDIVSGAGSGAGASAGAPAADSHPQFQNQLNEIPQKLEALKSKQEQILADQRLALEVVQNCNEVLRQILSTAPVSGMTRASGNSSQRREDDGGARSMGGAARNAMVVTLSPSPARGGRTVTLQAGAIGGGGGRRMFPCPWPAVSPTQPRLGGIGRGAPVVQMTPAAFGRGRLLQTAPDEEEYHSVEEVEPAGGGFVSFMDNGGASAPSEEPATNDRMDVEVSTDSQAGREEPVISSRMRTFRGAASPPRNAQSSAVAMDIDHGYQWVGDENAERIRAICRGSANRRRGAAGRCPQPMSRFRGRSNDGTRNFAPPTVISRTRDATTTRQSDNNQSMPNSTIGSPSRPNTTNRQHQRGTAGGGSTSQQRDGDDEDGAAGGGGDGVNFLGQIRFLASDSSDEDVADSILFHTFLQSGNGGGGGDKNQRENGDGRTG